MEITTGKWEVTHEAFTLLVTTEIKGKQESICQINQRYKTEKEIECNAILIANAGNTYQATNKLPSELAEANKELLDALKKALTVLVRAEYTDGYDATIEAELVDTLHKHTNHA